MYDLKNKDYQSILLTKVFVHDKICVYNNYVRKGELYGKYGKKASKADL